MKKINTVVIIYFFIGLPISLFAMFFHFSDLFFSMAGKGGFWGWLNGFVGVTFGLWILSIFYLVIALLFSTHFREELVARMMWLKQRDEREVISAGAAAKKTFFMTVALISFLLVVSLLHFQIAKIPDDQVKADGHHHILKMGLGLSIWNSPNSAQTPVDPNLTFDFQMPLSTTGILLLILVWELGTFRWYLKGALGTEAE